ncbi:Helitron helicase [Phytophthora megakarya]|uniref:Helitron helicase n=1 Tax=Phytophthora megakarya TaxID=4795 RepID=A0A225UWF7_9STRA|nr:Helitron helicase [Phytophthora megakarya]
MHEFTSVDSVDGDDKLRRQEHGDLYPPELLNTISQSEMPPHKLYLKVGTSVMMIRNVNTKESLCNGTRLRIFQLRPNCMEAAIIDAAFAEKRVILPGIALVSKNSCFRTPKKAVSSTRCICDDGQQIARDLHSIYQNQYSLTVNFMWQCLGLLPETT